MGREKTEERIHDLREKIASGLSMCHFQVPESMFLTFLP